MDELPTAFIVLVFFTLSISGLDASSLSTGLGDKKGPNSRLPDRVTDGAGCGLSWCVCMTVCALVLGEGFLIATEAASRS